MISFELADYEAIIISQRLHVLKHKIYILMDSSDHFRHLEWMKGERTNLMRKAVSF